MEQYRLQQRLFLVFRARIGWTQRLIQGVCRRQLGHIPLTVFLGICPSIETAGLKKWQKMRNEFQKSERGTKGTT